MFRLSTTVIAWCEHFWENGVLVIVPFYSKRRFHSVPFYGTVLRSVPFSHRFAYAHCIAKDKTQMLTPFRFMRKDGSIPYRFMALFYVPFRSLTVLQRTKLKRSHRTTIVIRRRGDVMAVSSAQASDPDNRRTCAFMCFSILCMRRSAKLIPYGAVLNRCICRAVMNRTVS